MQERILEDLVEYQLALQSNDIDGCLEIERRYRLDGYPPGTVCSALEAGAAGEDMDAFLDNLLGG